MVAVLREQVEAGRHPVAEEVRLGEGEIDALGALAAVAGEAHELSAAEEVRLADRDLADDAVGGRVAAGDREGAGRLVLDVDVDDHPVRRRARLVRDAHLLEVAEVVEPALGAVDQHLVVGVAFADIELAADDVVARAGVAADVDALDVDARAFLDDIAEVDGAGRRIAHAGRADLGEGVAAPGHLGGHVGERALDRFGVVDLARPRCATRPRSVSGSTSAMRESMLTAPTRYCSPSSTVMVTIVAAAGGVELRVGRQHAEVGVAVLEVVAADQLLVGGEPVGIVDVRSS